MRSRFCALLGLLLGACHSSGLQAADSRWVRAQTEHFTLYTDLSAARAAERAVELEQLLSGYAQHGFVLTGALPLRLNVVMFESPSAFSAYAGAEVDGFLVGGLLFEPWAALAVPRRADDLTVLRHELAHFVAYQGMQTQPMWLAEGIATYFETAHFDDERRFVIGGVPLHYWSVLQEHGPLDVAQLFARETDHGTTSFYATAWLVVHYLMSERGDSFERYQRRIAAGRDHADAWSESFADLPHATFDQVLRDYVRAGEFAVFLRPVSSDASTPLLHSMTRADRLALDGILQLATAHGEESGRLRAAQSLALARQEDPAQVQAVALAALEFADDPSALIEPLDGLTRTHPEHWLSWVTYGMALAMLGRLAQVEPANDPVAHALALAPRQPYAHLLAAFQHAERGEHEAARMRAARARRMAPTDVKLLVMECELLAKLHDCAALTAVVSVLEQVGHARLTKAARARIAAAANSCSHR